MKDILCQVADTITMNKFTTATGVGVSTVADDSTPLIAQVVFLVVDFAIRFFRKRKERKSKIK